MKHFITLLITLSVVLSSCSHHETKSSMAQSGRIADECKVEDVIKGFFNKKKWKYKMDMDEDSVITFRTGFDGQNESISMQVRVYQTDSLYQIICQSETKLSPEAMNKGIKAMNEYNLGALVASGCISPEGHIVFWTGRSIDGNTFSEEAFAADFYRTLSASDHKTAQICKQSYMK